MPIVSHEQSCQERGVSPAGCALEDRLYDVRHDDASRLCSVAFPGEDHRSQSCANVCAAGEGELQNCVLEMATTASERRGSNARDAHIISGMAVLVALFLAHALTARKRRTP